MIKVTLNLPAKRRLELVVIRSRLANQETPLFPNFGEVLRFRKGSKLSRIFRHIFENKKIQKVLGINLAITFLTTSLMQFPKENTFDNTYEVTTQAPFVIETVSSVRYPLDKISITQGYKMFHPGIDFDGITGDPVYPIMNGKVLAINYSKYAYGNAVLINHGSEITSLYAHLSKINVVANQEVDTHTIIGEMGATGRSFGDHLHLEIRDSGNPINPMSILPKNNQRYERQEILATAVR